MNRTFHIHLEKAELDKLINDLKEGTPIIEINGDYIQDFGFECHPIDGYVLPSGFPKCCPFHESAYESSHKWFAKFPQCCDNHKLLLDKKWFNKEDYAQRPNKIIECLSYTEHFISQKIGSDNWYKEITDYIEYITHSFGTPSIGSHIFEGFIQHYLRNCKPSDYELPENKRKRLLDYFEATKKDYNSDDQDIKQLYLVFQKWVKSLPKLVFFNNLKLSLGEKIPINLFIAKLEYNNYLKTTKGKIRTKAELIDILISLTKRTLSEIDTTILLQKHYISDKEKYEIDLLNEEHRINQKKLTVDSSPKEAIYLKIIHTWLKNERKYFYKIKPFIRSTRNTLHKFSIEKNQKKGAKFLIIFLREKSKLESVAKFLTTLKSVEKTSVSTNEEQDIIIYPSKNHSIKETESEVYIALTSFMNKGEYDPIFNDDKIELSHKGYESILVHIFNYGQNLEKFKRLYNKFDEEGFRDFFLPHLNTISKSHTATGETFNKSGKTDILIQNQEGKNIFIAECKLWKGENELSKAVDQLLEKYVVWRDDKVAIIVFNKTVKNFTSVLTNAVNAMTRHPLFEKKAGTRNESSFSFIFKNPDDSRRKIFLELILFNCN